MGCSVLFVLLKLSVKLQCVDGESLSLIQLASEEMVKERDIKREGMCRSENTQASDIFSNYTLEK